jgi:Ca2+-binding RTX toxin-like protein
VPTYNLDQLDAALTSAGYDQTVRAQVENYLIKAGYFSTPSSTIDAETSPGIAATNLLIASGDVSVTTGSSSPNPNLSFILDPGTSTLSVTGSASIGISLTDSNELLTLSDSGNDTVYTNGTGDTVNAAGSSGNDTFDVVSGTATVTGGTGTDELAAFTTAAGGELISSSTSGSSGTLLDDEGATGVFTLQGGAGNDVLYSSNSLGDTLLAGSGNQVLETFGSGSNSLVGGTGADTLYSGSSGADTLRGGTGANLLVALPGSGAGGQLISESLSTGSGSILDDESSTAHTLQGGAGADTLYSDNSTGDTMLAGTGNNTLQTFGSGSNSLVGGTGADTLISGSSGSDTLQGGTGANLLVAIPGAGPGELISKSVSSGPGSLLDDESSSNHTLLAGGGSDTLYVAGSGNDSLVSGSGNDQILSAQFDGPPPAGGNDTITAGASSGTGDSLYAGSGNDSLDGSLNTNFEALYSGTGNSTLDGGTAAGDYFGILNQSSNTVTVNTNNASTLDYVDMTPAGYASGSASGVPTSGSSDPNVTLTFTSGQTIKINAGTNTTVELEFTDKTITYHG